MTIVIADDTPDSRLVVRAILAPVSDTLIIVGEASDGEEALDLVRRERPDIVITDLVMPLLNGIELTRRIRQELPQTKIIFISIKPSIRRWKWIDTISAANAMVKAYCAKEKHLVFMDIEQQMLGPDGKPNPDLLIADGLHMTPAGYRIWTAALTPLLKER